MPTNDDATKVPPNGVQEDLPEKELRPGRSVTETTTTTIEVGGTTVTTIIKTITTTVEASQNSEAQNSDAVEGSQDSNVTARVGTSRIST